MSARHLLPAVLLAFSLAQGARADRLGGNFRGPGDELLPKEDPVPALAPSPAFLDDAAKAVDEATFSGRPVLAFIALDGCDRCVALETGAFRDPAVANLAARFVAVRVDAERDEAFGVAHAVRTLPTVILLGPGGRECGRVEGNVDAAALADLLKTALRRIGPARPTRVARDLAKASADLDRARSAGDWRATLRAADAIETIGREGPALDAAKQARKEAVVEAARRLVDAKALLAAGKRLEARRSLVAIAREFPGLDEAVEARNLVTEMDGPAPGGGGGGGTGERVPPGTDERLARGAGDVRVTTSVDRREAVPPALPAVDER